jgi:uncharacterized membrane protein
MPSPVALGILVGVLVGAFVALLVWAVGGIIAGLFVGVSFGILAGVIAYESRQPLLFWYTVELLALSIWIGGLVIIISSVIPAVFNSVSMESGGRLLTRVFSRYNEIVFGVIFLMLYAWAMRVWTHRRKGFAHAAITRPELALQISMIGIAIAVFVLGKHSVTLQETAFAAQGETAKKLAYDSFFRIHDVVRGLYVLNLALGIALLMFKIKTLLRRAEVAS